MSNSPLYWGVVILLGLLLVGYYWYSRHPTAGDIIRGKIVVPETERAGLATLLEAAAVSPHALRVVQENSDTPCWQAGWSKVDRVLQVHRQFGRFGAQCVGIDGGRITGISLVGHRLEGTEALRPLEALRFIQLREGRIASLAPAASGCAWEILILQGNALETVDLPAGCAGLTRLDLSFNNLTHISGIDALDRLEDLRADNNALQEISGIAGHPALVKLALTNNKLVSVDGIANLPWLESLSIAGNGIESLEGLTELPSLRTLHAGSNPIREIETAVLDRFPMLQHVALYDTAVEHLPDSFVYAAADDAPVSIERAGRKTPRITVSNTPLASRLRAGYAAAFDATKTTRVEQLPRGRGRAYHSKRRGSSGGLLSRSVDYSGTIAALDGTYSVKFDNLERAIGVTVRATVEKGRLRVYLKDSTGKYYYRETIPGHPLEVSGTLITGTSTYFVYLESVGGPAEGITWSCN